LHYWYPPDDMLYNSISTGFGHQTRLSLADGSAVWLNAASAILYPASFPGKERRVTITGEAYFEIEKDLSRPFIVTVGDMEIRVLGTHFNVNGYKGKGIATISVLEGAVKVSRDDTAMLLVPGQQVVARANGSMSRVGHADVRAAVAWKNG
jgi:transmembrane sensor